MKYFEVHSLYWLVARGYNLHGVAKHVRAYRYSRALSSLEGDYLRRHTINPANSTQTVIGFFTGA